MAAVTADSTEADSTQADSTAADSLAVHPDTTVLVIPQDSLPVITADTVQHVPDTLPEPVQDSLQVTPVLEETDTSSVVQEPEPEEIQETEEEALEPEAIVQP
jgi:hypothetical protein